MPRFSPPRVRLGYNSLLPARSRPPLRPDPTEGFRCHVAAVRRPFPQLEARCPRRTAALSRLPLARRAPTARSPHGPGPPEAKVSAAHTLASGSDVPGADGIRSLSPAGGAAGPPIRSARGRHFRAFKLV